MSAGVAHWSSEGLIRHRSQVRSLPSAPKINCYTVNMTNITSELISTNPALGYREVGRVRISSPEDVQNAVKKARKAFPAWRALSAKERGAYFHKFLTIYRKQAEELARLQTREMG